MILKNSTARKPNKYSVIFILLTLPFILLAQKSKIFYFDEKNNNITKRQFKKKIYKRDYLDIKQVQNDSTIHRLVFREKEGKINIADLETLREYLKKCTKETFLPDEIIVIKYYPGKDGSNSSGPGNTERQYIKKRNLELNNGLNERGNTHLTYLYKTYEGLEKQKGLVHWHPDIDGGIEKLFFKYHYPGYSYVVINTTGEYYAYFGEHMDLSIVKIAESFVGKNNDGK